MDDTLKGILFAFALSSIFMMAIFGFIVQFPLEQGAVFSTGANNATYLTISNMSLNTNNDLEQIQNQTQEGFNAWDVTQGFMGSNTVKQTSGTGIFSYVSSTFSNLGVIANTIFKPVTNADGTTSINPIIIVLGIFTTLAGLYVIYLTVQFVRTGR